MSDNDLYPAPNSGILYWNGDLGASGAYVDVAIGTGSANANCLNTAITLRRLRQIMKDRVAELMSDSRGFEEEYAAGKIEQLRREIEESMLP
jgi:hypothetical protein